MGWGVTGGGVLKRSPGPCSEARVAQSLVRELQTRVDVLEKVTHDRLTAVEGELLTLKTVVGATADDTLRACIVLEELASAGVIRPLPWRLATVIVELHHAQYAKNHNEVPEGSDGAAL